VDLPVPVAPITYIVAKGRSDRSSQDRSLPARDAFWPRQTSPGRDAAERPAMSVLARNSHSRPGGTRVGLDGVRPGFATCM